MSGVAWQIPLAAGQNIPTPEQLLNQQLTAAKLAEFNRQIGQQQQTENALRNLYADSSNFGPDGKLTPTALRTLGSVNPDAALNLQSALTHDALAQTQLKAAQIKEGEAVVAAKMRVGMDANEAYRAALAEGGPAAAQRAAQDAWSAGRDELISSGLASPQAIASMPPNYDFNRVNRSVAAWQAASLTPEQQETKREHAVTEAQKEEELTIQQQKENIEADREKREATNAEKGQWQVLTDPGKTDDKGNMLQYRYNAAKAEATTLSGEPYTPSGAAKIGAANSATPATKAEVDYWSSILKNGGALPPGLARTKQGSDLVRQIMANIPNSGTDPGDFIANHAQVKANSASLSNMTKMADAATSFERTAKENFDYALKLAPSAIPTSLGPFFNRWIEEGDKMFGDPAVPAYVTAMITAANEYAKIMSGSTGAQGSTVDSRREATELFSPYLSLPQIEAVVKVAEGDMDRRQQSLYGQVSDIRDRLKGGAAPGEAGPPHPKIGDIQQGYRFKGGDPAKQESWEKQ